MSVDHWDRRWLQYHIETLGAETPAEDDRRREDLQEREDAELVDVYRIPSSAYTSSSWM